MVPGALRRAGAGGGRTLRFYGRTDRTGSGGRTQCENRPAFRRTGGNIIVDFPGPDSAVGTFAQVKITQARNWILKGELAQQFAEASV